MFVIIVVHNSSVMECVKTSNNINVALKKLREVAENKFGVLSEDQLSDLRTIYEIKDDHCTFSLMEVDEN